MRPFALAVAILSLVVSLPQAPRAQARGQAAGPEIRLVLLVAVDQYRYDYLTRFRAQFTGGLAQLLTRGATFTQAYLDHYPTVTAVGHATMLSGARPAASGIIGNDWFDRALGASVTSVSDPATQLVGGVGTGPSPHRLLVSTLGDELKNAAGDRAPEQMPKVFGLSLKDRSAILPAGHRADGAYWYDTKTAAFVTSTYYRAEPHPWVAAFNARKPADAYAGVRWEFLDPSTGPGRGMPAAAGPQLYNAIYGSPFGNDLLKDFALAGLEAVERLGGPHLRARQPRGAGHRRPHGSRDRRTACAGRCAGRARPDDRRLHDRPRCGAGARSPAATPAARRADEGR
jgi:hypothetical protein